LKIGSNSSTVKVISHIKAKFYRVSEDSFRAGIGPPTEASDPLSSLKE